MAAHADGLALLAIRTGPASQADCQPRASSREIGVALRASCLCRDTVFGVALHGRSPTGQEEVQR